MPQALAHRNSTLLGTRAASTRPTTWRASDRSVEAVAATKTPVRSGYYDYSARCYVEVDEVLDIDGLTDADLAAFVGCPVLDSHSSWSTLEIVGVIDEARKEDGQLVVRMRISPTEDDIATKVEAGVIQKVSIGYARKAGAVTTEREGQVPLRVQPFEPLEISLVAVPADRNSGIRSMQSVEALRGQTVTPTPQDTNAMNVEAIRSAMTAFSAAMTAALEAAPATAATTTEAAPANTTAATVAADETRSAPVVQTQGSPAAPAAPVAGQRSAADLQVIAGLRAVAVEAGRAAQFDAFVAAGDSVADLSAVAKRYAATGSTEIQGQSDPSKGERSRATWISHDEALAGRRDGNDSIAALAAALADVVKR